MHTSSLQAAGPALSMVVYQFGRQSGVGIHSVVVPVYDSRGGGHCDLYPRDRGDGWEFRITIIHVDHSRACHRVASSTSDVWKVVFRELRVSARSWVLLCGTLLFLAGWLWQGSGYLGLVVGGALLLTFVISASLATVTPLLLKKVSR